MVWFWRGAGLIIAVAVFLLDQWVKWLVVDIWQLPMRQVIEIIPFFDLRWTRNFGVSLGMFSSNTLENRWLLVGVTALIAAGVAIWMLREKALGDIAALGMVLGGAAGNIRDRFIHGYVIDYADLHFGSFRPFLVFNIADAAIAIGVVIILARSFFLRDKGGQTTNTEQAQWAAENSDHA